jgi:hypothetical protein
MHGPSTSQNMAAFCEHCRECEEKKKKKNSFKNRKKEEIHQPYPGGMLSPG